MMARVRKDNDSWKAGAAMRRDERHTASEPNDKNAKPSKKKDKKLWCRGKVGVQHKLLVNTKAGLEQMDKSHTLYNVWKEYYIQYCSECGKEIKSYFGNFMFRSKKDEPDWVVAFKKGK